MAARDKTVVQGALIVCIIILLFSLVGNFFLWQSMDAATQRANQAAASQQAATETARTQSAQLDRLKQMIGAVQMSEAELDAIRNSLSADPEMAKIEQMFNEDMALLGPDMKASEVSYHNLPRYLMQTLRQRNDSVATDSDRLKVLTDENKNIIKRETDMRLAAQADKDKLQAKLQEAEEQFEKDRKDYKLKNQELVDATKKQQMEHARLQKELRDKLAVLEKENSTRLTTIDTQRKKITRLENDEFESAQGQITTTLPNNRVYINLGSADLLRTGLIFGVLNPDDVRISSAKPKARLEVVKVLADHMAEARVIELTDRFQGVAKGDPIYSPFWEPGRKVKIALAGMLDFNEDGRDDQQEVRALIESAGAEVVATLSAKGIREGKIDQNTRFVVVGSEPAPVGTEDPTAADQQTTYMAQLGEFQEEAKELGVTVISLNKLIGWLRTLSDARTIPLGGQARGSDFPPVAEPAAKYSPLRGSASELYNEQRDN